MEQKTSMNNQNHDSEQPKSKGSGTTSKDTKKKGKIKITFDDDKTGEQLNENSNLKNVVVFTGAALVEIMRD